MANLWRWPGAGKFKTVLGELGSKSNSRSLVYIGGKPRFIKGKAAQGYVSSFQKQIPVQAKSFEGPVLLVAKCYYKDRRRDLDVALLQDCIQKQGIIKNDRQIEAIMATRMIDKQCPRVEFQLVELVVPVAKLSIIGGPETFDN